MSIQPGVGYSVSNLGNVSSLSIDTIMPEAEPKQFECSIVRKSGETPEYHLRVRRGYVEFDYIRTNNKGKIDPEKYGTKEEITTGQLTNKTHCFLYAKKFNLFPSGKLQNGNNPDGEFLSNDGYIKLEPGIGRAYQVFIYKTVPDWGGPPIGGPPEGVEEARAPQIAVLDISEPVIDFTARESGKGSLQMYFRYEEKTANHWIGNPEAYGANFNALAGTDPNTGYYYSVAKKFDTIQTDAEYVTCLNEQQPNIINSILPQTSWWNIDNLTVGYINTDVIRMDLAYIRWNEGLKRFQIFQTNYGPINIRQIGAPITNYNFSDISWNESTFDKVADITNNIDGHSKQLNGFNSIFRAGDLAIGDYQKPYENS